jgi:hypothetical protein
VHIQWNKDKVILAAVGLASYGVGVGVGFGISHILKRRERSEAEEKIEELQSHQVELDFERTERTQEFNFLLSQLNLATKQAKDVVLDAIAEYQTAGEVEDVVEHHVNEEPWVYNNGNVPLEDIPANTVTGRQREPVVVPPTRKPEPEPERVTIFPDNDPDWNYDEELSKRSKDAPYIIHRDEFFEEEEGMDYRQDTLTFYAGDEILCDSQDVPIYKVDQKVGKLEFGKGSGDPNVVYVRNDKEEMEYEILFDSGYYQVEVRGDDIEGVLTSGDLKHSVRKFRAE